MPFFWNSVQPHQNLLEKWKSWIDQDEEASWEYYSRIAMRIGFTSGDHFGRKVTEIGNNVIGGKNIRVKYDGKEQTTGLAITSFFSKCILGNCSSSFFSHSLFRILLVLFGPCPLKCMQYEMQNFLGGMCDLTS